MTEAPPPAAIPAAPPAPHSDSWLMHVPIPLFAVVMGVAGLAVAWRRAAQVGLGPAAIGEAIALLAAGLFLAIAALYIAKALRHPGEVRREFAHPIRSAFFPTFSVSLVLLSLLALPYARPLALALADAGAAIHLTLTVLLLRRWLTQPVEIAHANPAWFIPVVGNIIVPVAFAHLGQAEAGWFFFAVGSVFWLLLFTVILYRLIFHPPLPAKLTPTLFILVAPPAVGFLAYEALSGGAVDALSRILAYLTLFLVVLLATLIRRFLATPFAVSWWAYTFPLDAASTATLTHAQAIASPFLRGVGLVLLLVTTAVVALVLARTTLALRRGALFLPE